MAQPNIPNISNAFQTLATEIANLPNLPVVNLTQQMQQIQQTLVYRMYIIFDLQYKNVNVKNFFLFLEEQRTQARIANSTIRDIHATIEPLMTNAGVVPPNFPQDADDIQNLTPAEINGLLTAYGLVVNGNVNVRKRRFTRFIGIISLTL